MRGFFIIFFLFSSCSFLSNKTGREINVESFPSEAEVSYFSPVTKQFKPLGKTPLKINETQIKDWLKGHNDFVVLRVSRSGYVVESLFVDLRNRYKVNYNAELWAIDLWNEKEMEVSSNAANKLAIKIQRINQQVFSKNLDGALNDAEKLIDQFPKANVFYDIKGSILMLLGRKSEALASYQKSILLNPDNNESKQMINRIEGGAQ